MRRCDYAQHESLALTQAIAETEQLIVLREDYHLYRSYSPSNNCVSVLSQRDLKELPTIGQVNTVDNSAHSLGKEFV